MRLHAIIEYANIAYLDDKPHLKIGGKSIYPRTIKDAHVSG